MKKIICLLLGVVLLLGSFPAFAAGGYEAVAAKVAQLNMIKTEEPEAELTRGEAVLALMRLYARCEMSATGEASVFSDVAQDSALVPYSNYAAQMGFVNGMGDGRLAPEEGISMQQFIKIAICVLGYQHIAENAGGYAGGYMTVAGRLGLLKNVPGAQGALTYEHAVLIIGNMLDVYPLEPAYGTDGYKQASLTLYEQLQNNEDLYEVRGLVTAVGKMALDGYAVLEPGEISVGELRMEYKDFDDEALLGRYVTAYYRDSAQDAIPVAVNIHIERRNDAITINARDIITLDKNGCEYDTDDGAATEKLSFESLQTVYNGRWRAAEELKKPATGEVTALDYDGDGSYELLFIDEYESFIVDRAMAITDTIYFEEGSAFRGKNGISFDFYDKDKEYEILSGDMEPMTFADIAEDDVISVWADMNEEKIRMIVCRDRAEGVLTAKNEETVSVDDTEYYVYEPNRADFMAKYEAGSSGAFALNHAGEIVDVCGEIECRISYGYSIGFKEGNDLKAAKIRLVTPGKKGKEIKVSGKTETVNRTYTNGDIVVLELNDQVMVYDANGSKKRVSADSLKADAFKRAIVGYETDENGKIRTLRSIKTVSVSSYGLNGDLHSWSDFEDAFYVGESTQVIFVPDVASPEEKDYKETFTVKDGSEYMVDRISVDDSTQIAECMVIVESLANIKNFDYDEDDVSVVSKVCTRLDSVKGEIYCVDVLTDQTVSQLYVEKDSDEGAVAGSLKAGDLIYYRANGEHEIRAIELLLQLSKSLGGDYYISKVNQENETVYGKANKLRLNYLEATRNERVDELTLDINGREKFCTFAREDGPVFYIYNKRSRLISSGVPEAIKEGVSDVFVYMGDPGVPIAVVIVQD